MNSALTRGGGFALALASTLAAGFSATAGAATTQLTNPVVTAALQGDVKNIVVIYAENRAFDNLFGNFPGAHGLSEVVDSSGAPLPAYVPQKDRNGSVLATLPQTWGGVTAAGQPAAITQAQSGGLPNAPFSVESAFTPASGVTLSLDTVTRDLYHRFFNEQMELGPDNTGDRYAAWADAGGLTMGHYDNSGSKLYKLAQKYVLADNFFAGAFGGSFLNHQYLICACAPEYPDAATRGASRIAALQTDGGGNFIPFLQLATNNPASALDGPPTFVNDGAITPLNYFGDGKYYGINTLQPPYQPSSVAPAASDSTHLFADISNSSVIPPQTQTNIGDLLNAAGVSWTYYAGSWNFALAHGTGDRAFGPGSPSTTTPIPAPNFQFHHQPFNYYANLDPATHAADRAAHLQDYTDLVAAAAAGTLPAVSFFKPEGDLNQHEGYTNVTNGDNHIADLVAKLQASPQWPNMVIVITYDEFGGVWDHVPPPKGDKLGPGTRLPAIVISPLAKTGFVDHTQYDTASILRLITRRFGLPKLDGLTRRDAALVANGKPAMGDLTGALNLPTQAFAFSAASYNASELSDSATITVRRTGDVSTAATVHYASSPGTAVPGVNYNNVSDTLSWAAGDASPKTFTVPLLGDGVYTPSLTVNLALSAPSTGAMIGAIGTATLNIKNRESRPTVDLGVFSDSVTAPSSVSVTAHLSGPSGLDIKVPLSFSGTARRGKNFVLPTDGSGRAVSSIIIPAGSTSASLSIATLHNASVSAPATTTLTVTEGSPTNGAVRGTPAVEGISITN